MSAARSGTLPADNVRAMFDRIAGVYDVMNTVMTAGLHHRWRERAVDLARVGPGSSALDVATGTGDLAIELSALGRYTERQLASPLSRLLLTAADHSEWPKADNEDAVETAARHEIVKLERGLVDSGRPR